ncbi:hypothetical protein EDB19DRAFT_2036343 [Suillus lakei]|nr:hypothetical protein EDB19DRAFT_2036343 [Suillus lakei]
MSLNDDRNVTYVNQGELPLDVLAGQANMCKQSMVTDIRAYSYISLYYERQTYVELKSATMATPLYIEEILELIIAELASDDDKQSLARLARSCKAFTDPCLDSIWHTMNSFSPFIPLLPRSVRSALIGERNVLYRCATIKLHYATLTQRLKTIGHPRVRMPRHGEWDSFDNYARRVRVYSQTDEHYIGNDHRYIQEAYQRVSTMRQKHLFPDLRDLAWRMIYNDSLESWSLPPSLQSLTICQRPFTALDQVLDQVAHHAPELETLEIRFGLPDCPAPYTTVDPLPFNRLKSVTLMFLDLARVDICHFLSLASVTDLTVTLDHSEKVWQPRSPVFHTLETLSISGDPMSASLFVKHVCSTRLREVKFVHGHQGATLSDCHELLAVLFKTHGQSLRSLSIAIHGMNLVLENSSTLDRLLNNFSSELRLHVRGSSIEMVKVLFHSLPHRVRGKQSLILVEFINHTWTQREVLQNLPF